MASETKIILTARDDTAAAFASANRSIQSLTSVYGQFAGVIAGVAGAGGLIALVKSSIDLGDHLGKLSQKTGISVESLSALKYASELSDVSIEALSTGLKKLAVNMNETAATGTGKSAAAFKALGIEVSTATGSLRPAEDVLADVAARFENMKDGAGKTALAVALFGKNGQEMIPFLNQGKEGLKAMADEARQLGIVIGADFAKKSEEFNDNLKKIKSASSALGIKIAEDLLPSLTDTAKAMVDLKKEGNGLLALLRGFAGLGKLPFDFFIPENKYSLEGHKKELKNTIADLESLSKRAPGEGALFRWMYGTKGEIDNKLVATRNQLQALEKFGGKLAAPPKKEKEKEDPKPFGDGSAKVNPFDAIRQDLSNRQTVLAAQSQSEEKLTDTYKHALVILTELRDGKLKLTAAEKIELAGRLEGLLVLDNENEARTRLKVAHEEALKIIDKVKTAAAEEIEQMRFETSLIGLGTLEVQKRTEARKIDLALAKELLALRNNDKFKAGIADPVTGRIADPGVGREYQGAVDAATRAASATKAGALDEIKARNDVARSWETGAKTSIAAYVEDATNAAAQTERLFKTAFQGAEDALVNFVKTGKLDFKSLADSIISELIRIQARKALAGAVDNATGFLGELFGGGGGGGNLVGSFDAFATVAHTGGILGADALAGRSISSGAFSGASRFHSGGIAGNEIPVIAQRGEGVFTKEQMRSLSPANQGGGNVSVTVNVDTSGSSVEGNSQESKKWGALIGNAVRGVLVQEKRPGGMLS